MYYNIKHVPKQLQVPLPYKSGFNAIDNPYSSEKFFKLCEDYKVPHNPMNYPNEKFYWTYQRDVKWPIGPNSVMHWIIENLKDLLTLDCLGFQKV